MQWPTRLRNTRWVVSLLLAAFIGLLLNMKLMLTIGISPPGYELVFSPHDDDDVSADLVPDWLNGSVARPGGGVPPAVYYKPPGSCVPQESIIFLKTHKCASSSVQNVFLRYGSKKNLTFALPTEKNYFGHPQPFHRSMVPDPDRYNIRYRILAHHTRLNEHEMRAIMPPDSVFITVLRDPVHVFESMYNYYDLGAKTYHMPLSSLLRKHPLPSDPIYRHRAMRKLGPNQNTFDLGLQDRLAWNQSAVEHFAHYIDSLFDLVMIAERLPESLILLKHLMCWTTDDVVVFKHNARVEHFKSPLSEQDRRALRKLNAADVYLYHYFSKRFDKMVRDFGLSKMAIELEELANRTDFWYDKCVEGVTSAKDRKGGISASKGASQRVLYFESKANASQECHRFLAFELDFTEELRLTQQSYMPRYVSRRPAAVFRRWPLRPVG